MCCAGTALAAISKAIVRTSQEQVQLPNGLGVCLAVHRQFVLNVLGTSHSYTACIRARDDVQELGNYIRD